MKHFPVLFRTIFSLLILIQLSFGVSEVSADFSSSGSRKFGLGLMLGEPSGLNAKVWLSSKTSLDFGLTYSFGSYFAFLSDYHWSFPQAFASHGVHGREFVPYLGLGGMIILTSQGAGRASYFGNALVGNSFGLAVRVPLGIEYTPQTLPLGVFAEVVPGLGLIPGMFGLIQGDIGVRYYF